MDHDKKISKLTPYMKIYAFAPLDSEKDSAADYREDGDARATVLVQASTYA